MTRLLVVMVFLAAVFAVACKAAEAPPATPTSPTPENGIVRIPPGEIMRPIDVPTPEPTTAPTPTPTASPTPSHPPTPEPTATPPAVYTGPETPGSCLVLPEEFCGKGELVERKNSAGRVLKFIGIRKGAIPKDVPVFNPLGEEGLINKTKAGFFSGNRTMASARLSQSGAKWFAVEGAFEGVTIELVNGVNRNGVPARGIIGYVTEGDAGNGYAILLHSATQDGISFTVYNEILVPLFPYIDLR